MNLIRRICRIIPFYYSELGIKGVAWLALAKCTGSRPIVKVRARGVATPICLRIGTTDLAIYKQVFIEGNYDFEMPEPPAFIIDAGANIGLASIYFANRYPDAAIVAIEPESSNFEMLQRNTSAYPQITPIMVAIWPENQNLRLFDAGCGNHGFQVGSGDQEMGKCVSETRGLTVDSIMRDAGKEKVDLLKIDIEGAEREVLAASSAWMDKVGVLMIELHEHIKPGCNAIFENATRRFPSKVIKGETIICHAIPQPASPDSSLQ